MACCKLGAAVATEATVEHIAAFVIVVQCTEERVHGHLADRLREIVCDCNGLCTVAQQLHALIGDTVYADTELVGLVDDGLLTQEDCEIVLVGQRELILGCVGVCELIHTLERLRCIAQLLIVGIFGIRTCHAVAHRGVEVLDRVAATVLQTVVVTADSLLCADCQTLDGVDLLPESHVCSHVGALALVPCSVVVRSSYLCEVQVVGLSELVEYCSVAICSLSPVVGSIYRQCTTCSHKRIGGIYTACSHVRVCLKALIAEVGRETEAQPLVSLDVHRGAECVAVHA